MENDKYLKPLSDFIKEGYGGELYRKPFYSNRSDYNTNSKSYYDYLARYNGFLSELIDFVNDLADKIGKYNHNSYYYNIVTIGAVGDNKTDNTYFFENLSKDQMYYVPHGTYRTEFLPHGKFFGWGQIKYKNEIVPLSISSPQKVRVNVDKKTDERYQSFILGQQAGEKTADQAYSMTGVGYSVFKENINGRRLTGFGKGSLSQMIYGYSNVGVGSDALGQSKYGERNTALGDNALKWGGVDDVHATLHDYWKDKGQQNFINSYFVPKFPTVWKYLGSESGPNKDLLPNGDGDYVENVGIGRNALLHSLSGKNNIAVGYNSQAHTMRGDDNTSMGNRALRDNIAGGRNTSIGSYASTNNITGQDNVSLGGNALQQTLHASNNTAVGYGSMHFFKDDKNKDTEETMNYGVRNTAIGTQTMQDGENASYSVMVGSYAGRYVKGDHNVGVGAGASQAVTTGEKNVSVGGNTHREVKTGSNNIAIGYSAGPSSDYTNTVSIGGNAHAHENNAFQLGNADQQVYVYKEPVIRSDIKYKSNVEDIKLGLEFVKELKPVSYDWKSDGTKHLGFIAQDIAEYNETHEEKFEGINKLVDENGDEEYTLATSNFIPTLVKAVQELSKTVETQAEEIKELKAQINK